MFIALFKCHLCYLDGVLSLCTRNILTLTVFSAWQPQLTFLWSKFCLFFSELL